MIEVLVTPTARCDRGCSHCEFSSVPTGDSISPSVLSVLPREFNRLGPGKKRLTVTGGGEPLLYTWTPRLIYEILRDRRNSVDLVTSGCTGEKDSGYKALDLITDAFRTARLATFLSYNSYNPTADERLRFTLPLLRKVNGLVCIKVAMSYLDRSPMARLDETLRSMGYDRFLLNAQGAFVPGTWESLARPEVASEVIDFTEHLYFRDNDFSEPDAEDGFCHYSHQIVSIRAQTLLIEGRAENLVDSFEEIPDHTTLITKCPHLKEPQAKFLSIDHTGLIHACCVAMSQPDPTLSLGKLGEVPLWEAMAQREYSLEKARKRTLLSTIGISSNPCGYCCDN